MADSQQLIFDWPQRPALGREDFLVTSCNQDAVDWIDLWPNWPAPALIVHGPPGCGKSHLAAVWQARTGAASIDKSALVDFASRQESDNKNYLLEDASEVADETALFHLFNWVSDNGGSLLLTAQHPAIRWNIRLPDLVSRLRAAPSVAIGTPDETLIECLLVKMAMDRQLDIEPEVIAYLLPRMERSYSAARLLVARLDEMALARKRTVTIPLARDVIREINSGSDRA